VKYLFVDPSAISSDPNVRVPPSDVDVPLIVIAEFDKALFGIFVSVFAEPLIDLFVNVCAVDKSAVIVVLMVNVLPVNVKPLPARYVPEPEN